MVTPAWNGPFIKQKLSLQNNFSLKNIMGKLVWNYI